MSFDLTEQQLAEVKNAFSLFDKDGDGSITKKELGVALRSIGQNPSESDLNEMISTLDEDGNGTIEFKEFVSIMVSERTKNATNEEEIKRVFRVFDSDGDGQITAVEIKKAMTALGEKVTDKEVKDMIRQADVDGDGFVNFDEFLRIMTAQ